MPTMLREFEKHKEYNIGILCGEVSSNLVVLDFDTVPSYLRWYKEYKLDTFTVKTRRGYHVYVRCDDLPDSGKYRCGECDVIANGYVVAPPSVHPSGFVYEVVNDIEIARLVNVDSVGMSKPDSVCRSGFDIPEYNTTLSGNNDSLVDEIKSCLSIVDYLAGYTDSIFQSSGDGQWLMCRCPFHNDGRESMWINLSFQKCKCLATHCKASNFAMDVIDCYALMKFGYIDNATVKEAVFGLASELRLL